MRMRYMQTQVLTNPAPSHGPALYIVRFTTKKKQTFYQKLIIPKASISQEN